MTGAAWEAGKPEFIVFSNGFTIEVYGNPPEKAPTLPIIFVKNNEISELDGFSSSGVERSRVMGQIHPNAIRAKT
jgi:hypothetical protein